MCQCAPRPLKGRACATGSPADGADQRRERERERNHRDTGSTEGHREGLGHKDAKTPRGTKDAKREKKK